jgi:peptide/nickel transport system permease protein
MSVLDVAEVDTEVSPAHGGGAEAEEVYKKKKLGFLFWASVVWLVLLVFSTVFAGLLPLKDPDRTFSGVSRDGPSWDHWFGADNIGHDVFSRTVYGARSSLAVAAIATGLGMLGGTALGMIAGFYRGTLDIVISAIFNILLAIPFLVFALALVSFLAPPDTSSPTEQTMWVTFALAVIVIPGLGRVVRAQTMVWADRDFVLASRTLGTRNLRIMTKEILPNVIPAMISFAFLVCAILIIAQAALAFFGVGDVSGVSWGIMIQNGRSQLDRAPHMVLFPALFLTLTVLALNFIGDAVLARFNVRESGI